MTLTEEDVTRTPSSRDDYRARPRPEAAPAQPPAYVPRPHRCAVDGTKSVSGGLIFPKTTLAMDVLPDRREPIRTILGARSARSLSPSEGVAGQRSRLAYMFLRARGVL